MNVTTFAAVLALLAVSTFPASHGVLASSIRAVPESSTAATTTATTEAVLTKSANSAHQGEEQSNGNADTDTDTETGPTGNATDSGADYAFQPNHPLLRPGFTHEFRYRTRTLTTPHEGSSSTGVELTCIVHFQVDFGIGHDSIVTLTITNPHVFRLGEGKSNEQSMEDTEMEELLTRHPLLFGLSTRGKASNIHTSDEDPLWVSNAKRAIVSLLQLDRANAHVGADSYTAVEHDIAGTCESKHQVGRRGESHHTVERVKPPSEDCSFHAVDYGDTPKVHRSMLDSKNSKDTFMTRHYFHGQTGRLDKVKYAESHSSAVHGNPNQLTTATSSGCRVQEIAIHPSRSLTGLAVVGRIRTV